MTQITVREGQSLLDISLQYYGSIDAIVGLAQDNGLTIGAPLHHGMVLVIDPDKIIDNQIVLYYRRGGVIPTTAYNGY